MKNELRPDCIYFVRLPIVFRYESKIPYCRNRNVNNDLYSCPCTENCSGYINIHEIFEVKVKDEEFEELMKVLEKYKEVK